MNLPPLPLVGGAFIIDNSGLEDLKCPRLFQYKQLNRKVAANARAGANFGSTIHRGLETRYNRCGPNRVDELTKVAIDADMLAWLAENPQPDMDFRDYNHACKMMAVYNNIYQNEQFKIVVSPTTSKPIIEASFCLPFGEIRLKEPNPNLPNGGWFIPIYYSGKIDLGIQDNNGIWSFDHKTAFQFGESFDKQMAMDGGQLGYCWALGQVLGVKPQGYIIDAIRVRRPKKQDEFGGIDCIDGTDFKRTPYYVTDDMLAEWREDVMQLIKNIFDYHASGHYPRHRWQCTNKFGMCDFYDVCSTLRNQREMVLESGMYEENTWSKGLKTDNKPIYHSLSGGMPE